MLIRHLVQQLFSNTSKSHFLTFANKSTALNMAEHSYSGKLLKDILSGLEGFAPISYAESWDNVGLLVDPIDPTPIKNILLTNDLTEDVLDEAINLKTGLIVSYHPNIFQGMKNVTSKTWKERIVVRCIKNNIAVFSPHTSWDAVNGGVNDWLAKSLPIRDCIPIKAHADNNKIGAGRICQLEKPVTIKEAVERIKKHIGIPHLRLALARNENQDSLINSVALCAGSGSSVLNGNVADLYLTGEMLHHDILDATQKGIHVILCNHSDSERGFLNEFKSILQERILQNSVQVYVAKCDKDPLVTV